jgi:multidrug efflux pump subunit AcrA (membrane-fusion protein)
MAYEPVYASVPEPTADGTPAMMPSVSVSAHQQQLIGVRVAAVEEASGSERLRLFGRVVPDERRVYRVNIGMESYVREMTRAATGSRVNKGEWLASVSTPDARTLVSGFVSALDVLQREEHNGNPHPAAVQGARNSVDLAADRLLTIGMSPVQIEEIRRSRTTSMIVKLSSPGDGFIVARNVSAGQRLGAGTELFQIADLRRVWIVANLPDGLVDDIRPGTSVEISIPGRRRAPLRGRISTEVLPQFDARAQAVGLRIDADNPDFVLRPDMFVDVSIDVPYAPGIVIPVDAVIASGLRNTVFVERERGSFVPRTVEIGRRLESRVEVLHGLEPGERIAISGTFLLDSESRLRGIRDK